jgi:hypothetical protein
VCAWVGNQRSRGVVTAWVRTDAVQNLHHQHGDLHQSTYLYLLEDRDSSYYHLCSKLTQESIEFGGREVNQLKAAPVRDNENILILYTSVMPMSLTCARNYPICSYVIFASSLMNLARSGTQKPHGYGIVSKYLGYGFWYNLAQPIGVNPNSREVLAI